MTRRPVTAAAIPESVLVVGASLAGHATARALRREGFSGSVTVIGAEPHRPYDRPPLSKELLAGRCEPVDLDLAAPDEDLGVDWHLGVPAVALDAGSRTVELADGRRIAGDAVVIATGSVARRLPGAPAGVHTVRGLDDALALRAALHPGSVVAVVGAGFIGSEIASTVHGLGHPVTVIEAAPVPLAMPLGLELGAAVAGLHAANGVEVRCGVGVAGFTSDATDRVTGVRLADGSIVPADVVVVGIGADPAVAWLHGSGIEVAAGVVSSAVGGTSVPGIWAVGDCAAWYDAALGGPHRIEHWTDSRDRPATMVKAMLGRPTGSLRAPYFWSDQYGVRIQFAGRRRGDEQITIEAGAADTGDLLAVYRRAGAPVAVLGMNQPSLFMRYRKALPATPTDAPQPDNVSQPVG
jgi:NADPH-dependent 2,4-dienoyl-CoA reductase/sulfur reductase-like enzyme